MSSFYEQFMGLSVGERERIASEAGLSLAYILKHIYVSERNPKFHFHNAVEIDLASGGALPFMQHTTHADTLPWGYIRRTLNRQRKQGAI